MRFAGGDDLGGQLFPPRFPRPLCRGTLTIFLFCFSRTCEIELHINLAYKDAKRKQKNEKVMKKIKQTSISFPCFKGRDESGLDYRPHDRIEQTKLNKFIKRRLRIILFVIMFNQCSQAAFKN